MRYRITSSLSAASAFMIAPRRSWRRNSRVRESIEYWVMTASALLRTPFRRNQPPLRFVVMTLSEPPGRGGPLPGNASPKGFDGGSVQSHSAAD
jgi:hypothetical protein